MKTMNHSQTPFQPGALDRRKFLGGLGAGFGALAFNALASQQSLSAQAYRNPLLPQAPHFPAKVKRVIFMFMPGGVAHMDTFDPKPKLTELNGKPSPVKTPAGNAKKAGGGITGSFWKFKQHGNSGAWVSDLLPHLAKHVDDLCFLKGMHTDVPAHVQGSVLFHTGQQTLPRPSIGSWVLYGLGTENQNMPGFITLRPPDFSGGTRLYGSAFLPGSFQATEVGSEQGRFDDPRILDVENTFLSPDLQTQQLRMARRLNEHMLERTRQESNLQGLTESYELAFRMQTEAPEVMDLTGESAATLESYGIGSEPTDNFGRQCLLARRFAESGVRFIQINATGGRENNWDHHSDMRKRMEQSCLETDQPTGALIADLKLRGLWEDTLLVCSGEFGRTPDGADAGTDKAGRDHNHQGFSLWLGGGGVKPGFTYGATDELGLHAIEGRTHVHDLHATILHLLGLDHEKLTFPFDGRNFRLTDVYGNVVKEILS